MRMMRPLFVFVLAIFALSGCGEAGGGGGSQFVSWTVRATAGPGGSISPATQTVVDGDGASLSLTPDSGYSVESVTGCGGTFDASTNTYNIGRVPSTCLVTATFTPDSYTATATAGPNGSITPDTATLEHGASATFTVTPAPDYGIAAVTGCGGTLVGDTYTTGEVTADCKVEATFAKGYTVGGTLTLAREGVDIVLQTSGGDELTLNANGPFKFSLPVVDGRDYAVTIAEQPGGQKCVVSNGTGQVNGAPVTTVDVSGCVFVPPAAPEPNPLGYDTKELQFSWTAVEGATHYRVLENRGDGSGYDPNPIAELHEGVDPVTTASKHEISLPRRVNARYMVEACTPEPDGGCTASSEITLADRLLPAIGYVKASNTGAGDYFGYAVAVSGDGNTLAVGAIREDSADPSDQSDDMADETGAVYIFTQTDTGWSQQAYLKGTLTGAGDRFGYSLALSETGDTLAVGAYGEDSAGATDGGAVYVFSRSNGTWDEQSHLVPPEVSGSDHFGSAVALSADGHTLAVGVEDKDASADVRNSGAVYIFTDTSGSWSQEGNPLTASSEGHEHLFGCSVSLSRDGSVLAVGAYRQDNAIDPKTNSGAAYVYTRTSPGVWTEAFIKALNAGAEDNFGYSVALSADGSTLAVGAPMEESSTIANPDDNQSSDSGAVYVFSGVGTAWTQQKYLKASNVGRGDEFGVSVALSSDGTVLAVGAHKEDSISTGVGGNENDESVIDSGAAYLFVNTGTDWTQQAYIKSSNTDAGGDNFEFGSVVALSMDGNTLSVGAYRENGDATGVNGEASDLPAAESGAVYLY